MKSVGEKYYLKHIRGWSESTTHSLSSKFAQLRLDNTEEGIENFVSAHKPISHSLESHKADFWNSAQASFLKQSIKQDADWVETVDHLDLMLR